MVTQDIVGGRNKTVLFEGAHTSKTNLTLSDSIENYDEIVVYASIDEMEATYAYQKGQQA